MSKIRTLRELPTDAHPILTIGSYDPLHIGHIKHFQVARNFLDYQHSLIVLICPDRFITKPNRPVFNEQLRAESVAALECVDLVAINEYPTAVEAIHMLKPAIFVKGSEYRTNRTPQFVAEEEAVLSYGGRIEYTDEITFSSTELLKHAGNLGGCRDVHE